MALLTVWVTFGAANAMLEKHRHSVALTKIAGETVLINDLVISWHIDAFYNVASSHRMMSITPILLTKSKPFSTQQFRVRLIGSFQSALLHGEYSVH